MPEWISKLITGGQCKTLYAENIDLDLQPTDSEMIRKLCELYSVSLVNVRVNSINDEQNVALGLGNTKLVYAYILRLPHLTFA